jgi:predicted nucleic acid-binding protein
VKVLFDTNVVLDLLLAGQPHGEVALQLVSFADSRRIEGFLCATSVTTLHYLTAKAVGRKQADKHLREILAIFQVAPVDGRVLNAALEEPFGDYEDAVLHEAARIWSVDAIVTRNLEDFRAAKLSVFSPQQLLAAVLASGQ